MTKKRTHIAAWGTTFTAIMAAVCAFPMIAQTAQEDGVKAEVSALLSAETNSNVEFWLTDRSEDETTGFMPVTIVADSKLSMAEQKCLAEAVYYEARSETRSGQKAVAEVVMNRVTSKHYPNSVCGVVYQGSERRTGCQFSFTCDGSMDIKAYGKAWDRSVDVAEFVLSGGHIPMTNRSTHYHTLEVNPKWSKTLRMTRRVGSHVFYRFAPRDYRPSEAMVMVAPPI